MKKLHLLLIRAYLPPFFAGFFIILFVMTLQFISTYQNDIFGKGFGPMTIAQLFLYAMANLVKTSLPISLLIAGLMTLGKLGEQYELAAIKSAGISLFRVIYPLFIFAMLVTAFSFYLSTYVIPQTNLKLYSLLYDMKSAKPALALKPGVNNKDIPNYNIWFKDRTESGTLLRFHLWDHTDQTQVNSKHLVADSARIYTDDKLKYLRLILFNGVEYNEQRNLVQSKGAPFRIITFDSLKYAIDIAGVGLNQSDEDLFKRHQYTQNLWQIQESIDSLEVAVERPATNMRRLLNQQLQIDTALAQQATTKQALKGYENTVAELIPEDKRNATFSRAQHSARQLGQWATHKGNELKEMNKQLRKYQIEYMSMYAVPIACVVMLFIGAPLGAIIRKGGLGVPSMISIVFFMIYYMLQTQGKKMAQESALPVWAGVWLPILCISPIAIYLTYQSATDSRLFDASAWKGLFRGLVKRRKTQPQE